MSTNYYAHIKLGGTNSIETKLVLHIGKTGGGVSFSGDWFASAEDWKRYLSFNADKIDIIDENGVEWTVEDLFTRFEGFSYEQKRRQYDAIARDHSSMLYMYWLDGSGYTFSKGEFF